jgi:hypothetical protein
MPKTKKGYVPPKYLPNLTLLCKLSSIVAHAKEMNSPHGHVYDKIALDQLLKDDEVTEWMGKMLKAGFAVVVRQK